MPDFERAINSGGWSSGIPLHPNPPRKQLKEFRGVGKPFNQVISDFLKTTAYIFGKLIGMIDVHSKLDLNIISKDHTNHWGKRRSESQVVLLSQVPIPKLLPKPFGWPWVFRDKGVSATFHPSPRSSSTNEQKRVFWDDGDSPRFRGNDE